MVLTKSTMRQTSFPLLASKTIGNLMKLAQTIRLDVSKSNVFTAVAESGEWAVTQIFIFADSNPRTMTSKNKIAFRDG